MAIPRRRKNLPRHSGAPCAPATPLVHNHEDKPHKRALGPAIGRNPASSPWQAPTQARSNCGVKKKREGLQGQPSRPGAIRKKDGTIRKNEGSPGFQDSQEAAGRIKMLADDQGPMWSSQLPAQGEHSPP
ncbi:hypothetical protein NDU88_000841 [Pleurodeles waltl]|uniref:Uncharacterized protein n=1 Tax=Pleurodeles waltl TaxID=8319 RepID=A0AAV7WGN1_PLEWA|nr:hypothetical protein NDU88_000841 [Pleurodeles waltl]